MSGERAAIRRRILDAALRHVPFDGWSDRSLRLAHKDLGLDRTVGLSAFPRGRRDLLEFFLAEADRRMVEELAKRDLSSMPVRERIAGAVRLRLEQHAPHREAVRRAVAARSLSPNGAAGLRSLYRTTDAIWRAAGDQATDFNFYTKRALLAWVYGATLLVWLDDESEGCAESWAFLERRIAEVMRVGGAGGRLRQAAQRLTPWPLRPRRQRPSRGARA